MNAGMVAAFRQVADVIDRLPWEVRSPPTVFRDGSVEWEGLRVPPGRKDAIACVEAILRAMGATSDSAGVRLGDVVHRFPAYR